MKPIAKVEIVGITVRKHFSLFLIWSTLNENLTEMCRAEGNFRRAKTPRIWTELLERSLLPNLSSHLTA